MEKRREYDALAAAAVAAVAAEDDDVVLPGFRFHPTDEELVGFYLRRKVEKRPLCIEIIKEFDIYRQDPWDLPKAITAGENELYFFCLRGRKYRNSIRPNRVTQSGFWKATGIDRPIHSPANSGACVGLKKSLVYYRGSAGKGTKTDWMMHEFRLPSPTTVQEAEVWTICRIFRRSVSYKRQPNSQTQFISHPMAAAHKSSSITSCFETEKGREHRGSATSSASSSCYPNGANYNGEVGLVADYYCAEDQNVWMLCGGQWSAIGQAPLTSIVQAPLTSPAPCIAAQTPSICELFVDSDWNELAGIVEFMADSSLPCNER